MGCGGGVLLQPESWLEVGGGGMGRGGWWVDSQAGTQSWSILIEGRWISKRQCLRRSSRDGAMTLPW